MVNKVGDIALLLAIAGAFLLYGSIDFSILFALTPYSLNNYLTFFNKQICTVTMITFFMFLGAIGKSAQLGLHT